MEVEGSQGSSLLVSWCDGLVKDDLSIFCC